MALSVNEGGDEEWQPSLEMNDPRNGNTSKDETEQAVSKARGPPPLQ